MKRFFAMWVAAALVMMPALGCNQESGTKTTKTVETPDGKTKVTNETKVEKSGDNPPPAK